MTSHLKLLSVDPGNRAVKIAIPNAAPIQFASIIAHVPQTQRVSLGAGSVLISYIAGNKNLIDRRWIAGASAKDYSTSGMTYLADKAEQTPFLVLAAVPASEGEIEIATLYVSHPNPDLVREQLVEALQGSHQYTRETVNGKTDVRLQIAHVQVLAEGSGSLQMGYRSGVLLAQNTNGIIDLGGGTVIASLWKQGREIPNARVVLEKQGSFGLAQMIARDTRMSERLGARAGKPKTEIILDAIANGSLVYGTTGTGFEDIYDYCLPIFWTGIKEAVLADWTQWIEEVESIILTGGASPLLRASAQASGGFLTLLDNPQYANALGMLPESSEATAGKKLRVA